MMALVKASSEAIGLCQLASGWGLVMKAEVFVDSSAALAVTDRRGCGRLRHVRKGHLWVQELALAEEMAFRKVRGDANPADLMTKYLVGADILYKAGLLGVRVSASDSKVSRPRGGVEGNRLP